MHGKFGGWFISHPVPPPSAAVIVGTIFWNQNLIFIGEQPGDWGEFGSRLKYTKQTQDSRQVTIKLQTNLFIITILIIHHTIFFLEVC